MYSHSNTNDYSTNINKKVAKLETDLVLLRKRIDESFPTYNVKNKFDAHSQKIFKLEANSFKIRDLPELKNEIYNTIMSKLIELGVVDEEDINPSVIIVGEEEEETEVETTE
jgi:hypothetical protein